MPSPAPIEARRGPHADPTGPLRWLVPFSGVQFLPFEIDAATLPMISVAYVEDDLVGATGSRRVLLPVSGAEIDGALLHPVTFTPLGPRDTLSYTGIEAIEPFLDTWLPVPYLRYLGRGAGTAARYDRGPANWTRLFVCRPAVDLRTAERLRAVLAVDTRLDVGARSGEASMPPNLAPLIEDALFAATFDCVTALEDLSGFLAQSWVDQWLREALAARAGDRRDGPADTRFTLGHLARYLALLEVLRRTAELPRIRLLDSVSASQPTPVAAVDLVLDLGPTQTTALLVPQRTAGVGSVAPAVRSVRLRDLGRPTEVHDGPIPTAIEFDNQTFGSSAISRRSGRTDAFAWPSVVRIGHEARRLALRANAVDGVTGAADIANRLAETRTADGLWRFSTGTGTETVPGKVGPMVSGEVLRHLTEDGTVTGRTVAGLLTDAGGQAETDGAPRAAAAVVRPRFSVSALSGLFVAELLTHALADVADAEPAAAAAGQAPAGTVELRRIARIVVTMPVAMPAEERALLLERVEGAVDLVWRTQRFEAGGPIRYPPRPTVVASLGADVGLQIAHLHDEVGRKLGGSFGALVDLVRRRTGEPDARDSLRVASVDVGHRALGLTVVDYDVAHDGTLEASLVLTDRAPQGGQRIVDAVAEMTVAGAIARVLGQAGVADPHRLLRQVADGRAALDVPGGGTVPIPPQLGRRLDGKVVRPAAAHLFAQHAFRTPGQGRGVALARLSTLVAAGGGRLEPTGAEFAALAVAAGAHGFDLGAVEVMSTTREMEVLLDSALGPAIAAMAGAIRTADCDLLLIGGELARMPGLLDRFVRHAPVPVGRIAVVGDEGVAGTGPGSGSAGSGSTAAGPTRASAVMAAFLAGEGRLATAGFAIGIGRVATVLALAAPDGDDGSGGDDDDTDGVDATADAPATPRRGLIDRLG
jgi:hypothetical protein